MTARCLRLLKQLARIAQQITEAENLTGEAQTNVLLQASEQLAELRRVLAGC